MNLSIRLIIWMAIVAVLQSCGPKGLTIEGDIANASNLQVFVDEVRLGKASNIMDKTDMAADGSFSMAFPDGLPAGIYNIRIGAKRINLVLDGTEKVVKINGNLETIQNYDFTVSGSGDSQTMVKTMQGLFRREYKPEDITAMVDSVKNAHLAAFIAYTALGRTPQFAATQRKAADRLKAEFPNTEAAAAYATYVTALEQESLMQAAAPAGPITVGMDAPNISMASPTGKTYSLADLKGKVVLLDFWASWCGPCRMENPNVVEVYKKYKDQGFTVFSVSLDGVDSRSAQRFSPADLERAMDGQKQRWVDAIKQDNLIWEYHVSELKKWESTAGALYGVSSIPRTFLIGRDGKIAAVNLRGAAAIEAALKQAL